jgi:streptogramin lyase
MSGRNEALIHLDPRSHRVIDRVPIEPPLSGVAFDGTDLWTISAREAVLRIDPASGDVRQRFVLPHFEPESITVDGDTLWVASSFEGDVLRVDADTGKVRDRIAVDGSLFGGSIVGDSYWVADNAGTIYRIDAKSGAVVDRLEALGFGPIAAAGNLWTVDFLTDTVYRLDEPA